MSGDPNAYLASLSQEQAAAAKMTDEPVMIIAGAGSGKTRTLVGRLIHLMKPVWDGGLGADPSSIMMVTFTNKAAREMRERILPVIEQLRAKNEKMRGGEPWIGTFHSLSLRILRIEAQKAGMGKNFSIFDESDARALAKEVAENLDLDTFDVDTFFRDLEFAKARLLTHDLLAQKALDVEMGLAMGGSLDEVTQKWSRVLAHFETQGFTRMYSAYQRALDDQNAVDFSDLMNRVTRLFQENPDVRRSWMSSFRHFMVDEVQDINRAQVSWLDMLTNGGRQLVLPDDVVGNEFSDASEGMHEVNTHRARQFPRPTIAMVGDDDQSIYGFRGSDPRLVRDLLKKYPGMEIRFLKQSYRCQPSILSVANTLVANNADRFGKDVEPADPGRPASRLVIEEHVSPDDEIRRIVAEAIRHVSAGNKPDEYAVLVRTRDHVKAVARELRAAGLPVSEGKASDIRKSAEVRDAMAFAGFMMNPEAETFLRRIINKPARGLGPTSIGRVSVNARIKGISLLEELRLIMNGRIDLPDECEGYKTAFIRKLKDFGQLVMDVKTGIMGAESAGDAILGILEKTGYLPDLKAQAMKSAGLKGGVDMSLEPRDFLTALIGATAKEKGRKSEDLSGIDGEDLADRAGQLSETARRIGNLALLIDQARQVETLEAFMQEATLEMEQGAGAAGIQVMTVHASKGLEFDVVRMPFFIDGIFPHSRAVQGSQEDIDEERRLAYVAITRAREDVRISRSWKVHGCAFIRQRESRPSRFIEEIRRSPRSDFQLCSRKPRDPVYNLTKLVYDPEKAKDAEQRPPAAAPAAPTAPAAPAQPKPSPGPAPAGSRDAAAERFVASMNDTMPEVPMDDRPFAPPSEEDMGYVPEGWGGGDMEPDFGYDPRDQDEVRQDTFTKEPQFDF